MGKHQKILKRANKFLPHIFWRWYFLELENREGMTPYFYLDWIKEIEGWPKNGQFFPEVSIEQTGKFKHDITISLEYISFFQQPLLVDLKNLLMGEKSVYNFDELYRQHLQLLLNYCQKNKIKFPNLIRGQGIYKLLRIYWEKILEDWYNNHKFVQDAFSLDSWQRFWQEIIADIVNNKDYSTEQLLDQYSQRMRQFFPDFSFRTEKLKDWQTNDFNSQEFKEKEFSAVSFMDFWYNFCYRILIPFSLYLHLLVPVFIDQELFQTDIRELLARNYQDPMPIYTACSYLYLTPFGQKVFKNILTDQ